MTLSADIATISADSYTFHAIIHGPSGTTVATDSGPCPTIAEALHKASGGTIRGPWAPGTYYAMNDVVYDYDIQTHYRCVIPHTSNDLSADISAGRWIVQYNGALNTDNEWTGINTFDSAAPSSVSAGQVAIGGGQVLAAGQILGSRFVTTSDYALSRYGVASPGAVDGITIYSDGKMYFGMPAGTVYRWYVGNDAQMTLGTELTITGTAPSSVSAGQVAIGGGEIWTATPSHVEIRAISAKGFGYDPSLYSALQIGGGTGSISLGVDVSTIAGGQFHGSHDIVLKNTAQFIVPNAGGTDFVVVSSVDSTGVTTFKGAATSSVSAGQVAIGGGKVLAYGVIETTSTSDGAIKTAGKITAKVAVPASFADLADVRTYLASILT